MVPLISFTGSADLEEFVSKVLDLLKERGYRVAVLKEGITEIPLEGYKADGVCSLNSGKVSLFRGVDGFNLKYLSFLLFDDYDIVVCLGVEGPDLPRFELLDRSKGLDCLENRKNVIGVVSDKGFEGIRTFPLDRPEELVNFIEDKFIKRREDSFPDEVELFVNGRRVPMKHYVKETLREILFGFIKPLKGIDYPVEKLDIRIVVGKGRTP